MSILKATYSPFNESSGPFLVRQWRGLMLGLPPVVQPARQEELFARTTCPQSLPICRRKKKAFLSPAADVIAAVSLSVALDRLVFAQPRDSNPSRCGDRGEAKGQSGPTTSSPI